MIDLTVNKEKLERAVERAREKNIILPTFKQMKNPETMPRAVHERLKNVGLWDVNSVNLFRITWKNEPKAKGGLHGGVNYVELPQSLTGVKARIIALVGRWFPTGAHKVGASYACLAPRLVTGQFDPTKQKAVWPSTGNYCRGGAYNSALLACDSIAILPAEMSKERFEWLKTVAGEVIATPGCESNVKEIYDKCWELRRTRGDDIMIFNQFEEFGNYLWHYDITGHAIEEVVKKEMKKGQRFSGAVFTTGSAGTIGSGDFLKQQFPGIKIGAGEATQCPTLLMNGFGGHRIEGIGDKHVPWIHNVKNTDMVIAIDDNSTMNLIRLFNEPAGRSYLKKAGVPEALVDKLDLVGISGMANILMAIKMAKWYEMTEKDIVFTVLTDSMELYGSRIKELEAQMGKYDESRAAADHARWMLGVATDSMMEAGYQERKRVHNLKYYTWVEQQGKTYEEIQRQWYDDDYWLAYQRQLPEIDKLIDQFNEKVGLLK